MQLSTCWPNVGSVSHNPFLSPADFHVGDLSMVCAQAQLAPSTYADRCIFLNDPCSSYDSCDHTGSSQRQRPLQQPTGTYGTAVLVVSLRNGTVLRKESLGSCTISIRTVNVALITSVALNVLNCTRVCGCMWHTGMHS